MEYFKVVCIGLGAYNIIAIIAHFLFAKKFPDFIVKVLLPSQKPIWIWPMTILMMLWMCYTWWLFFSFIHAASFLLSLYLTLGFLKMVLFVSNYDKMRLLVAALIIREKVALNIILFSALALGLVLVYLGLLI